MSNDPTIERTIQQIWSGTLQENADPALTVHRLPDTAASDVEDLARTIRTGSAQATILESGAPTRPERTTAIRVGPPPSVGRESVSAQDLFQFQRLLGKGGMGVVYAARQESLHRDVAVKTMLESADVSANQKAGFLREALTTGALAHPNIVPVYLFGRDSQGRLFLVMKQVSGSPWSKLLKDDTSARDFDIGKHLDIFQKVCDAVAFAHARAIVHRDLKPENVMVGDFGEVTVMDWGLALDVSGNGQHLAVSREKASVVAGTPAYMAPEMALGEVPRIGPATDIYLLGAILHELVTGRPPHTGRTIWEVVAHAAEGKLEALKARPGLPREVRELERILRKAMAPDPAARYQTVSELKEDLRAFQQGQGDRTESDEVCREARAALDKLQKEVADLRVVVQFYPRCAEILAKTQQSLTLWGHNPRAVRVRQEALALHADLAVRSRDWGLAESLLRDVRLSGAGGAALAVPLEQRMHTQRSAWQRRQVFLTRAYRFAAVMFFVTLGCSLYLFVKWQDAKIFAEWAAEELTKAQAQLESPPADNPEAYQVTDGPPLEQVKKAPEKRAPNPAAVRDPKIARPDLPERWWIHEQPGDGRAADLQGLAAGPGGRLALWDGEGGLWLWTSGQPHPLIEEQVFKPGQHGRIVGAVWADERSLVFANTDGEVMLGENREQPWSTLLRCGEHVQHLAAVKGKDEILVAAFAGNTLWRAGSKLAPPVKKSIQGRVTGIGIWPDGAHALSGEQMLYLWEADGRPLQFGASSRMPKVFFAAQARRALALSADDPTVVFDFDLHSGHSWNLKLRRGRVAGLSVSPDGRGAIWSDQGELVVFRGRQLSELGGDGKPLRAASLSPDGSKVYTIDNECGVRLWKVE